MLICEIVYLPVCVCDSWCLSGVLFHCCWLAEYGRAAWEMTFPPVTSPRDREGHRFVSFIVSVSLTVPLFLFSHYNENRRPPSTLSSHTALRDGQCAAFFFLRLSFSFSSSVIKHADSPGDMHFCAVFKLGLRENKKNKNKNCFINYATQSIYDNLSKRNPISL